MLRTSPTGGTVGTDERDVVNVLDLLRRYGGVDLPVRLWTSRRSGPVDASYVITLKDPSSLRAMLWPPSDIAAGQAYVNGAIDIDGDAIQAIADGASLASLTSAPWWQKARLLRAVLALPKPREEWRGETARAQLTGKLHSRERDRQAVAFHYDRPAEFYATFLDRDLTYSCAYFDEPMGDLDLAQRRKHDLVCRKLLLKPGQRLLDIGCGFGSLLLHAASHFGVEGVGVTLSRTQADVARRRVAEAGLSDRIDIRLMDYRDVDEQFDAVASIGMIEHVGPGQLDTWFATARRVLRPGGLLLCHGITLGDPNHVRLGEETTFVTAYVFPDGGLVPAWRAVRHLQQARFQLLDLEQLRPHYEWTLRHWIKRLERNHDAAVAAADERAYRIWRVYMAGSAYSFATGSLEVIQLLGRAPGEPQTSVPVGRAWMIPAVDGGHGSTDTGNGRRSTGSSLPEAHRQPT